MNNEQCVMHDHSTQQLSSYMCNLKRISWTAVIVGALVGIGLSFLLNLFSIAIGLSIVTTTQAGMVSLAIGGFLGLLIGTLISMFTAGFAAGYLGRPYCVKRNLGVVYGFTTWCLALVLTALLTSHIGHYAAAYSSFITHPTSIVDVNNTTMPTAHQATTSAKISAASGNVEAATNNLGISSFLVFVLFFVGALASCFGGHFGMYSKKDCSRTDNK